MCVHSFKSVGLSNGGHFELPITQNELGDTMGLSTVHVKRSLQSLRAKSLITFDRGQVVILDLNGLKALSGFNPNYLHLEKDKYD